MATMIDALARSADRIFSSLDRPSDGGALSQYVASLGGGSEEQVALEKSLRLLHMFVRFGDALGTVQACDALVQLIRTGGATRQAVLDGSALPSLVLVLQTDRPDSWRAATELLAELAAGDDHQRRALLRSGAVPPLVQHLRHATEPTLLREGARLLAALAVEPTAATALLREGAARALVHLCRSDAVQAHALSVRALGQLALTDAGLLRSPQVLRVLCRVAGGSVLEARLAATRELTSLLELPTNRPPLLRAHVVAVLLQCADSLNEELKLAALRGLAQLLAAAFTPPPEQRRRLSPAQAAAEQAAASACAAQALGELSTQEGAVLLLRLARDASLRVRAAALGMLSCLCADQASVAAVEAARAVPLLVALCGTAAETPPERSPPLTPRGHHVADASAAARKASLPPSSSGPAEATGGGANDANAGGSDEVEGPSTPASAARLATVGNAAAAAAAGAPRRRIAAASLAVFSLSKAAGAGARAAEAKALGLAEARQQAAAQAHCVEQAVSCLAQLMSHSSSAQLDLVNARGVAALVALLSGPAPLGHGVLSREVARALMTISSSKIHRPTLHAEGAVQCLAALVASLEGVNHHELTLRYAAAALGNLATLPDAQMVLAAAGAIPHLVRLARAHDADTQRHAARAIGNLAANASCQHEIGSSGGLRPLIKCGYSRSTELQELVARALVNLALDPQLNQMILTEGGAQLLLNLARSPHAEVAHWARVAQGNVEAANALGPLVRHCPQDSPVEPIDMVTMSSLVSLLRARDDLSVSVAVQRLTACAVANLCVSAHNQRLLIECNGIKPLVALANSAADPELASQCMRGLANLAVTAEYRPNMLQAKVLSLLVKTLERAQLQGGGAHTYAVLSHAARGLGNLCDGGEIAAAMQLKTADEGGVAALLPLLAKEAEEAEDVHRAGVGDRLAASIDELLRETVRALAKLAQLRNNRLPMVSSEQKPLKVVVSLMRPSSTSSLGLKGECLELLNHLADAPQALAELEQDGIIPPLLTLVRTPDLVIEASAAELLAKLAQVKEYQLQISRDSSTTLPTLIELLHSSSAAVQLAGLRALIEMLFDHLDNQLVAMKAGVVEPAVRLARSEERGLNHAAATLLCTLVLSEAEGGAAHAALRLQPDSKLQVLAAMAMSSNADAHGVAAMGLATMCSAPGNTASNSGAADTALIAKVALPALVRLARSAAADTQCAALDALVVLSDLPQVQRDLVKMGALKVVLERAATPGADNADIRALALQVVQSLASNGANIGTLQSGEVAARLKGLRQHMRDDVAVGRAVDAILRSISTISTLLELQGKQRLLRFGEVAAMLDCVGVAGAESSISREVAHTCAAIGARRENLDLFTQEGGFDLLNSLARSRSAGVQGEAGEALAAFARLPEAHQGLATHGCLLSLVGLARSRSSELQLHAAAAFAALADTNASKTALVQAGAVPPLLSLVRTGSPEVVYLAAKALLYLR